ncbi:hypothetical protein [Marinoscillum furvescens]|uniref:CcmD family protein n=1 Tax=Marinoscillum furvescens DSM 4134 TaxID=1122208 RepID=A0A3D9LI53_MARFU|nr:hypothetical protein [Marinoscillum furvescens]REE05545.1 hypothetical protein C7460_10161 [Marinoscillum furvescens DSM 4134]
MKRFLASVLASLMTIVAFAQEKAEESSIEIKINGKAANLEIWWKGTLLIIFTLIIVWLVVRTFRGKANV